MSLSRRAALRVLTTGVGGCAAAAAAPLTRLHASAPKQAPPGALGMLFDTTLCIGCQACMVGCREANDLKYQDAQGMYYDPADLEAGAKTVIKRYVEGTDESFYKAQCMHCIDPACASACMFGALQKRLGGIVTWNGEHCTGCRYCEIACPFNVPRFEWRSNNPEIVKCEMCAHLIAEGGIPRCVEVCPREAIVYGTRDDLLAEAHRRIEAKPDLYVNRVYGETEAGGTQVLYLSHVPFEKLGLPNLSDESLPDRVHRIQGTIYKGFVAPITLFAVLGTVIARNRRREREQAERDRHGHTGDQP
jgi:Fe-S-cluster-containing dehydrogenase component